MVSLQVHSAAREIECAHTAGFIVSTSKWPQAGAHFNGVFQDRLKCRSTKAIVLMCWSWREGGRRLRLMAGVRCSTGPSRTSASDRRSALLRTDLHRFPSPERPCSMPGNKSFCGSSSGLMQWEATLLSWVWGGGHLLRGFGKLHGDYWAKPQRPLELIKVDESLERGWRSQRELGDWGRGEGRAGCALATEMGVGRGCPSVQPGSKRRAGGRSVKRVPGEPEADRLLPAQIHARGLWVPPILFRPLACEIPSPVVLPWVHMCFG